MIIYNDNLLLSTVQNTELCFSYFFKGIEKAQLGVARTADHLGNRNLQVIL